MREPVTRRPGLDAAAFEAAVLRVVERTVAASADDTAGARVVARLVASPTWRPTAAQLLVAPAAVAFVVLAFVHEPRTSSPPAVPAPFSAARQAPNAPVADEVTPAAAGTTAASNADERVLVGVSSAAVASSGRRRGRPRPVAAPLDDDPSGLKALVEPDAAAGTIPGLIEMTPAPEPLPVDALELVPLEATALDPRPDE